MKMFVIAESMLSATLLSKMSKKCTFFIYTSSDHNGDNDDHDKYTDHEKNVDDNVFVVVLLK